MSLRASLPTVLPLVCLFDVQHKTPNPTTTSSPHCNADNEDLFWVVFTRKALVSNTQISQFPKKAISAPKTVATFVFTMTWE